MDKMSAYIIAISLCLFQSLSNLIFQSK